jgi:hypothetical protein
MEADRPREPVGRKREIGEPLGQAAVRGSERQLDLEESFGRLHEPLREPQVVLGGGDR